MPQQRLYPWTLTQLRMPHSTLLPTPEWVEGTELHDIARQSIYRLQEAGESELLYKISAYTILDLVRDALSLFVSYLGEYEGELIELDQYLPRFLKVAHGDAPPVSIPRALIIAWRGISFDLDEVEEAGGEYPIALVSMGNLFTAAERAAEAIAGDRIGRSRAIQSLSDVEETDSLVNDNINALFYLLLVVRHLGANEVRNVINIWWNRTFARLAFVQEEKEYTIPESSMSWNYMVKYNPPGDEHAFYGNTREEAISYAQAYDPNWHAVSTVWVWNGEFYQRD